MIVGAHTIIYTKDAEADRAFLRDVLKLPHVDAGEGWLIFGLPPAEVACHPGDENDVHEFYLMCDDVAAFVADMRRHNLACAPVQDQGYGLVTQVTLPGGGKLGVYQPRHARPQSMGTKAPARRGAKRRGAARRAARPGKRAANRARKPARPAKRRGKPSAKRGARSR